MKTIGILPSGEWCEIQKYERVCTVELTDEQFEAIISNGVTENFMCELANCDNWKQTEALLKNLSDHYA